MGADGIKILGIDRDTMQAMEDEAHKLGLRIAHHAGVEETNAWDDIKFGTTSIEHWYGIPDAAIEGGVQNFPSSLQLQQRDRPLPLRRPPVARGQSRAPHQGAAGHGGRARGLGSHHGHLRGQPRPAARAERSPGSPSTCTPRWRSTSSPNPANHGSYFIGWTSHRRDVLEGELPPVDGGAAPVRPPRRPDRHGRRRRLHLPDVRLRPDPRHGTAPGGGLPSAQDHPAGHRQQREDSGAGGAAWAACAPAGPPT